MDIIRIKGWDESLNLDDLILITCHAKPDGDAIGSVMGLYHYLKKKGMNPAVTIPNEQPHFLKIVPQATEVCLNFELNKEKGIELINKAKYIFCLDYNRMSRIGEMEPYVTESKAIKVNIDHHLGIDEEQFDFIYSIPEKSSTCEMVFDFILMYEDENIFDQNIMQSLYTGMVTDTGSFKYASTSADLHRAVAMFFDKGLIHSHIQESINDSWSIDRMKFLGDLLLNHLHYYEPGYGMIYIGKELLQKYQMTMNMTEGIVNYILSIADVKIAILITERGNEIKLSFRSKGNIDVNYFSNHHFGGGGHLNASGASSYLSKEETLNKIHDNMPSYLSQYLLN